MSFGKITICPEDTLFSKYIRKRDKKCMRCRSPVSFNEKGEAVTHQNSHFWSRKNEATRFDPDNCDTLCANCHHLWGGDYREQYTEFKKKQLGEKKYKELMIRAHMYYKKDRITARMYVKDLIKKAQQKT